nr:MAG TPA: hypothetical protein [Caudoviricetes sp.]
MEKTRRLARMADDPDDELHGTPTGYNYGCRCDRCREAKAASVRRYRLRKRAGDALAAAFLVLDDQGGPVLVCAREADAKACVEMIGAAKEYRKVMAVM